MMHFSCKCHKSYKEKGFTLVELLLVLSLLGIVLGTAYAAFYGTYQSWSHNETINPYIASTNTTLNLLSREIRSAESPTSSEYAVKALDTGKQLVVYKYRLNEATDPWEMISYRYNGSVLQRSVQKAATGADIAMVDFPDDSAVWTDQLPGVAVTSQQNSFLIDADTGKVDIRLAVSDVERPDNKRFADYNVASSYFPRNRAPGSLYSEEIEEEETEVPNVPIFKLELLSGSLTIIKGHSVPVSVQFWPANTTNKVITCSTTEYVSVQQDANDPSVIYLTGVNKTPKILGFPLPQKVTIKSVDNPDKSDSLDVIVK